MSTRPTYVTEEQFEAAWACVRQHVHHTPMLASRRLSEEMGLDVVLKAELFQRTGSYKIRGALNKIRLLDEEARARGVICSSAGNHAQGVALAAALNDVRSVVVMARNATPSKVAATKAYGAEVILHGEIWDEANQEAMRLVSERGYTFLHPFDDLDLIAGQGTVGMEMMEQAGVLGLRPDIVLVGASGGGLIGGVSLAVKETSPATLIYSVEPAGFDDLARSLAHGQRERNERLSGSICDALMSATPGEITFEVARRNLAGGLAVTDEEAKAAVRFAFRELKLVVEPGGAVSLAAILARKLPLEGKTVMAVLSGGNIDPALFAEIIQEPRQAA